MGSKITPVEGPSGSGAVTRFLLPLEAPPAKPEEPGAGRLGTARRARAVPPAAPTERLELGGRLTETHAQFVFDEHDQLVQVRIVDTASNRVLREIPPDALVKLAATLRAYQDAGQRLATEGEAGRGATARIPGTAHSGDKER